MEIRFLDVAQQELDEAVEYYNAESLALGVHFLLEALAALKEFDNSQKRGAPIPKTADVVRREGFPMASFTKSLNPKYSSWPRPHE